jgi:hypothetical protein
MNPMQLAGRIGPFAFGALLLSGCDSNNPSGPAAQAPSGSADAPAIVYSESFADAGTLTIMKDAEGRFGFDVQARIGSEAERLMGASSSLPTLADVYRSLHGNGEEVPAAVAEASEQLGTRPADAAPAERPPERVLAKAASQSEFSNGYCRDIHDGGFIWRWRTCIWENSVNYTGTEYVNSGDRVYGWNKTPETATLSIWNRNYVSQPNTWRPTLPPYSVAWFQWGGSYSGAWVIIMLPYQKLGELGVSDHAPIPDVH